MRIRLLSLIGIIVLITGLLAAWPVFTRHSQVSAALDIYASPIHGGCYIAAPSDCRIHVEPFTLNLTVGTKLVYFALIATRVGAGIQTTIYDFRPDVSNPVPLSGSTYTPSLVAQDYAAICGATYTISLQGKNTGDPSAYNLGMTGQFTCPASMP